MEDSKNGKGDSPRNCFSKEFRENFESIDWSKDSKYVIGIDPNYEESFKGMAEQKDD